MAKKTISVIGWREWVGLPDLAVNAIKAKIDTGARSSALHAFNVKTIRKQGADWVSFDIHPLQRNAKLTIHIEYPMTTMRKVKSSSGHETFRPVIATDLLIMDRRIPIELTLVNRDTMGFRMLLGRTAIRRKFLVNPSKSFLAGATK